MSWDEYKQKKACPCRAGTYTITRQENDWGKSHEWYTMNCERCLEKYVEFTYSYHDPGAPGGISSTNLWVLKEEMGELDRIRLSIQHAQHIMVNKATARYSSRWLQHFEGKSKKDVWEELKALDRSFVPSLGTFYKHTSDGVDIYLRDLFNAKRLTPILDFLGATDLDLTFDRERLLAMERAYDTAKTKMIRGGVYL